MNLLEEIQKEHSKKKTLWIAKWVGGNKKRFTALMNLFLTGEYRVVQRASWVVQYVARDHPALVRPWLKKMLEYCRKPVHDAVKRNVIRILQDIKIPKNIQGLTATVCFDFLSSVNEPVAVKVFSMTVLANICKSEPDLKRELKAVIEEQMEWEKPSFRSRGKKVLEMIKGIGGEGGV